MIVVLYLWNLSGHNLSRKCLVLQKKKNEMKDSSPTASDDSPEHCEGALSCDFELSPPIAKAFQYMMETISKTINDKLDSEVIHIHSQQMENCKTRLDEAEKRIASAEELAESMQARVLTLESQVASLTDHVADLENRGQRKKYLHSRLI